MLPEGGIDAPESGAPLAECQNFGYIERTGKVDVVVRNVIDGSQGDLSDRFGSVPASNTPEFLMIRSEAGNDPV